MASASNEGFVDDLDPGVGNILKGLVLESAPPSSHRDYAYNIKGVAYDHRVPRDWHGKWLSTRQKKGTPLTVEDVAPVVIPSDKEIKDYELAVPRGVWVGMCLPAEESFLKTVAFEQTYPEKGDGTRSKSASIAEHTTPIIVAFDAVKAFRVVCYEGGLTAKYYALSTQTDGLCETRSVPQDMVFFFPKFRDTGDKTTSVSFRIQDWNARVRQATKPKAARAIKDEELRVKLPFQMEITNAARLAVSLYGQSFEPEILHDLERKLTRHISTVAGKPSLSNSMILRLFDSSGKASFSEEDADFARTEIEEKWPALGSLSILGVELVAMHKALVLSKVTINFRHVRMFLVDFISRLRPETPNGNCEDETLIDIATTTQEHVDRQAGPADPEARPPNDDVEDFISACLEYLNQLMKAVRQRNEDRLALYGSSMPVSSLEEIMDALKAAPDETTLRMMANQIHRYELGQTILGDDVVIGELETLVKMMKGYLDS